MNRIEFIKLSTLGIGTMVIGCTIEDIKECPPTQPLSGSMAIQRD